MGSTCILTDSTAQFTQPSFPGRNIVNILSLDVKLNSSLYDNSSFKVSSLPASANDELNPQLIAPSPEKIRSLLTNLGQTYDEVIGIFISSYLNQCFVNAEEAAVGLRGRMSIQMIDSQTTSIGLGLLVQTAAEAVAQGNSFQDIEQLIRSLLPHIYAVFCTPNLSYLHYASFLDHAQALVGEMMGMLPIWTLEEGKLTPQEKVRSRRHAFDFFQEFINEFDHLQHIALLQNVTPNPQDARLLREQVQVGLNKLAFTEHTINLPLATLLGPSAIGLFLLESTNQKRIRR
jgi:DegV family protein with EDD domain